MPMTLTLHLSQEMHSLFTRDITETWVHSCGCVPPRFCVHREIDNMGEYGGPIATWAGRCTSFRCHPGRLENYSVRDYPAVGTIESVHSALSEIMGHALPYDDILALRDRMWELSPSLVRVRYDTLKHTSTDIALAGLKTTAAHTASVRASDGPFLKPIANFYQTDPISRAYVLGSSLPLPNLTLGNTGPAGR